MLEEIYPLLGKSIESDEIKALFTAWNVEYPKKTTCTPNNSRVKTKMMKDDVLLNFTMGGYSKYTIPIPAKTKNSYVGIFTMIEIKKKCKIKLPFDISHASTPDDLTNALGEPKVTNFVGKSTMWRKNITDKHEITVSHDEYTDGTTLHSITINFIFDPEV
jgi:hypothetical protein